MRNTHLSKKKILHIGNIANNAYNNAKILNKNGFINDVISPDYYHVMGCPEWEELDIEPNKINEFNPEWFKINKNYKRPGWFIQGPLNECLEYLIAKNCNNVKKKKIFWKILEYRNKSRRRDILFFIILFFIKLKNLVFRSFNQTRIRKDSILFSKIIDNLISRFANVSNCRPDKLSIEDFKLLQATPLLSEVLTQYDYIFCYGTSAILPTLNGFTNFVAYEHGTIRDIPWQNNAQGRLTALSYTSAKSILMTNADSIQQAKALNARIYFGQHGFLINDSKKKIEPYSKISILKDKLNLSVQKRFIFFQSTRQDWKTKGNDKFLKAVLSLKTEGLTDFEIILVHWGDDVQKTKTFFEEHNLSSHVHWISPLSKPQLLKLYTEVDIIVDQFNINCIGSTPLEIFSVKGAALLTSLDDDVLTEYYGRTIPLINCKNSHEIYHALKRILKNEINLEKIKDDCHNWLIETHSEELIARTLLRSQGIRDFEI